MITMFAAPHVIPFDILFVHAHLEVHRRLVAPGEALPPSIISHILGGCRLMLALTVSFWREVLCFSIVFNHGFDSIAAV
jgi:hypothetical protein